MQRGVIIALSVSLILVSWATWYRHISSLERETGLITVAGQDVPQAYYDELAAQFSQASTTSLVPTAAEQLTTTDLVGRQLITEYLGLTQSGEVTDESLSALAEKYIQGVPTILTASTFSALELRVVANTEPNFKTYATALEEIYRSYATNLIKNSANGSVIFDAQGSKAFTAMSKIYNQTADALKTLPVPAETAGSHLALINTYLQSAVAVGALAGFDTDPASSFAGLIAYKNSTDKETEILLKLQEILAHHGV